MKMKYDFDLHSKIQEIYSNLDLLDGGHFKENDPGTGLPGYHTMAKRMRENLDYIVKKLESKKDS